MQEAVEKENAMKKDLYFIVAVVTCLALTMMACNAVTSLANSGNSRNSGSSGNGGNSSSDGGSNSGGIGNTSGTVGKVLFRDDFSDDQSGWGTASDANKLVQYTHNTLEVKVFKDLDMVYSKQSETDYQDVHIEVTAAPNNSDKDSYFGILCDQQVTSEAFYYVAVKPGGDYVIARAAVAQDDVYLTGDGDWKTSKLIPVNAPSYTIGMDCGSDGTLALYVNGKQVDTVTDTTYTSGHIGLFAATNEKPNSTDVNFSNYVATSLK
jgi:hypothetical protein